MEKKNNNSIFLLAGKSTGLVTTTRVTHATPAALYAHAASRYWEDDGKVPPVSRTSCKDIARQLLEDEPGYNITVRNNNIPVYVYVCVRARVWRKCMAVLFALYVDSMAISP